MILVNKKGIRGFTLVELIIVLVLIGLVSLGALSLFSFGTTTYMGGGKQNSLQNEARLAMDALTEDIRYATHIRILTVYDPDNHNSLIDPYETVIYYSENNIVKRHGNVTDTFTLTTAETEEPFSIETTSPGTIEYTLVGEDKNKAFTLTSEINLLNIKQAGELEGTTGTVIAYITPDMYWAKNLDPDIKLPDGDSNNNSIRVIAFIYNRPSSYFNNNIIVVDADSNTQISTIIDFESIDISTKITINLPNSFNPKNNDILKITINETSGELAQYYFLATYKNSAQSWSFE